MVIFLRKGKRRRLRIHFLARDHDKHPVTLVNAVPARGTIGRRLGRRGHTCGRRGRPNVLGGRAISER